MNSAERLDFSPRQFYTFPGADPAKPTEIPQEEIAQQGARSAYRRLFGSEPEAPAQAVKVQALEGGVLSKNAGTTGPGLFARLLAFIRNFVRQVVGRLVGGLGGVEVPGGAEERQAKPDAGQIEEDRGNSAVGASLTDQVSTAVDALCNDVGLINAIIAAGESDPEMLADALNASLGKVAAEATRLDAAIDQQRLKYEQVRDANSTAYCSPEMMDRFLEFGGKGDALLPDVVAVEMTSLRELIDTKKQLDDYVVGLVTTARDFVGPGDSGLERVLASHPFAKDAVLRADAEEIRAAAAAKHVKPFVGSPSGDVGPVRSDVSVSMELMTRLQSRQAAGEALKAAAAPSTVDAVRSAPVFSKRSAGVGALAGYEGPSGIDLDSDD